MKRWLILAMLATVSAAWAQDAEQLMIKPPAGWKVGFHERRGAVEITEIVPPGQTTAAWQDMLVVELIDGKPAVDKDVQTILRNRVEEVRADCPSVGAGETSLSTDNGYESGMRAIACPRSKKWNKGEVSLFKVILGNDRTYVVIRSWRSEPFEKTKVTLPADKMTEWLGFMAKVVVCDPRDPNRACPVKK